MGASIQAIFSFGTDKAKSDLNALEKDAQSFGQRVKSHFQNVFGVGKGGIDTGNSKKSLTDLEQHAGSVSEKIAQHFRRDKFRRAELALSEFGKAAITGDVGGAVEGLAGRVTGLGLGIGVAVGVGVALFKKLTDVIVATKTSYNDLEVELGKPISGLGVQGLTAQLSASDSAIENFRQKHSGFLNIVKESFGQGGIFGGLGAVFSGGRTGSQQETALELNKAFEQQGKIRKEVADNEAEIVAIKEKSLKVSESEAELDKISLDASQKKAAIDKETADRRARLQKVLADDEAERSVGRVGLSEDVRRQYQEEIKNIGQVDEARKASVEKDKQLDQERVRNKEATRSSLNKIEQEEAQQSIRGQSQGEGTRRKSTDKLKALDEQLKQPLPQEQREKLEVDRSGARADLFEQTTQNYLNPKGLVEDINQGILKRQQRRALVNNLKQRFREDSGEGQSSEKFRDYAEENREQIKAINEDISEGKQRLRYHGLTRDQAQELMQDQAPSGPPPSSVESPAQPSQKFEIPGLEDLKNLAERVGKAVYDAMVLVWGN